MTGTIFSKTNQPHAIKTSGFAKYRIVVGTRMIANRDFVFGLIATTEAVR